MVFHTIQTSHPRHIALLLSLLMASLSGFNRIDYRVQPEKGHVLVSLNALLGEQEAVMQESLSVKTETPEYTMGAYTCDQKPIMYLAHGAAEPTHAYTESFACEFTLERIDGQPVSLQELPCTVAIMYHHNTEGSQSVRMTLAGDAQGSILLKEQPEHEASSGIFYWITHTIDHIVATISDILTHSDMPIGWMLVVVFLLGLLTSLTPCIYPMIPITVGILQGGASTSFASNFLRATAYACGISTTYSIIGMVASVGKTQFGSLSAHPLVIGMLVLFFAYLAGSMLGWYEMYTPGFMQPKHHHTSGGSYLGAFIFGLINGTIASPCLSPSLALVLGITAHWSLWKAFMLIFIYGIGTCTPLLLIATYTQSMEMLPRAGTWMVEIKKFFGIMLFGMCIYIARPLLHISLYYCLFALLTGIAALYYLHSARYKKQRLVQLLSMGGILLSGWLLLNGLHSWFMKPTHHAGAAWTNSIDMARAQALQNHKRLLINASAPSWCSACVALEHKLLHTREFEKLAQEKVVLVSLDNDNPEDQAWIKHYQVVGFPRVLLIDPETDTIVKSWGAELIKYTAQEVVAQL